MRIQILFCYSLALIPSALFPLSMITSYIKYELKNCAGQMWWCMLVIPATGEIKFVDIESLWTEVDLRNPISTNEMRDT
jgi:integral membrane sensor domain MASE1